LSGRLRSARKQDFRNQIRHEDRIAKIRAIRSSRRQSRFATFRR
jgi:hypothetical protein